QASGPRSKPCCRSTGRRAIYCADATRPACPLSADPSAFPHPAFHQEIPLRILHTMLRVGNLERSIDFYTNVMGMQLLRRNDYPEGKFTLAFVGYGPETEGAVIELTHNWDTDSYNLGDGYGHIAIEVDDAYAACDRVTEKGGKVVRPAGPM